MSLGLILLLIAGLSFLIGIVLYKKTNNKKTLSILTSSCAFIVILGLICFDLIPELLENFKWYYIVFVLFGLGFLSIIDLFIPNHHHEHHENDEEELDHQNHLVHIGIITIIALMLHNMVEGIALYGITLNDTKSGILMCIAIMLHNIPLGFQVGSYSYKKNSYILITFLVLSALIGGLLVVLFGSISMLVLGIITSLTLGMLLHILIFELLGEIINNKNQLPTYYGIIIGIVLLVIINLL